MRTNPTQFHAKLTNMLAAWSEFAPESKFAGMSLAEFKTAVARSIDSRSQLEALRLQIKGILADRSAGDAESRLLFARVVGGVIADGAYGSDSTLYRALDYIPRSERARSRTKKLDSPTAVAASATAPTTAASAVASTPSTK